MGQQYKITMDEYVKSKGREFSYGINIYNVDSGYQKVDPFEPAGTKSLIIPSYYNVSRITGAKWNLERFVHPEVKRGDFVENIKFETMSSSFLAFFMHVGSKKTMFQPLEKPSLRELKSVFNSDEIAKLNRIMLKRRIKLSSETTFTEFQLKVLMVLAPNSLFRKTITIGELLFKCGALGKNISTLQRRINEVRELSNTKVIFEYSDDDFETVKKSVTSEKLYSFKKLELDTGFCRTKKIDEILTSNHFEFDDTDGIRLLQHISYKVKKMDGKRAIKATGNLMSLPNPFTNDVDRIEMGLHAMFTSYLPYEGSESPIRKFNFWALIRIIGMPMSWSHIKISNTFMRYVDTVAIYLQSYSTDYYHNVVEIEYAINQKVVSKALSMRNGGVKLVTDEDYEMFQHFVSDEDGTFKTPPRTIPFKKKTSKCSKTKITSGTEQKSEKSLKNCPMDSKNTQKCSKPNGNSNTVINPEKKEPLKQGKNLKNQIEKQDDQGKKTQSLDQNEHMDDQENLNQDHNEPKQDLEVDNNEYSELVQIECNDSETTLLSPDFLRGGFDDMVDCERVKGFCDADSVILRNGFIVDPRYEYKYINIYQDDKKNILTFDEFLNEVTGLIPEGDVKDNFIKMYNIEMEHYKKFGKIRHCLHPVIRDDRDYKYIAIVDADGKPRTREQYEKYAESIPKDEWFFSTCEENVIFHLSLYDEETNHKNRANRSHDCDESSVGGSFIRKAIFGENENVDDEPTSSNIRLFKMKRKATSDSKWSSFTSKVAQANKSHVVNNDSEKRFKKYDSGYIRKFASVMVVEYKNRGPLTNMLVHILDCIFYERTNDQAIKFLNSLNVFDLKSEYFRCGIVDFTQHCCEKFDGTKPFSEKLFLGFIRSAERREVQYQKNINKNKRNYR